MEGNDIHNLEVAVLVLLPIPACEYFDDAVRKGQGNAPCANLARMKTSEDLSPSCRDANGVDRTGPCSRQVPATCRS